jgi:predicted Zn-dependent peptidase
MTIAQDTLDNGMRVVTDRMDSVETVTLGVWVEAGARNETAEINGVSHLLEHMAFKGTGRRSALDIAVEIENVGGYLNAYTSRETTVYYATVLRENVDLALDILSDILMNSAFAETELERERAVIVQEIGQVNDVPDEIVFDRLQEIAFPDQPLGRPILGTSEIVQNMPRTTLVEYMDAQYAGDRMILGAAGNVDHADLLEKAARCFSGLVRETDAPIVPGTYVGGEFREQRDLEQAHIILGLEGLGFSDPDYYPLAVLSTALGGGMSSRLFQEVREKRGLVYSIYTFSSAYRDGGLFGIYAGTGEEQSAELVAVVVDELCRAANDIVNEDELRRARTQIKAGVLMSLESTSSRAERLARHLQVYGRIIPIQEISERIDGVTAQDVQRAAQRLLTMPPTLVGLGPVANMGNYESVVSLLLA